LKKKNELFFSSTKKKNDFEKRKRKR